MSLKIIFRNLVIIIKKVPNNFPSLKWIILLISINKNSDINKFIYLISNKNNQKSN